MSTNTFIHTTQTNARRTNTAQTLDNFKIWKRFSAIETNSYLCYFHSLILWSVWSTEWSSIIKPDLTMRYWQIPLSHNQEMGWLRMRGISLGIPFLSHSVLFYAMINCEHMVATYPASCLRLISFRNNVSKPKYIPIIISQADIYLSFLIF